MPWQQAAASVVVAVHSMDYNASISQRVGDGVNRGALCRLVMKALTKTNGHCLLSGTKPEGRQHTLFFPLFLDLKEGRVG